MLNLEQSDTLPYLTFKVFGLKKATWPEDPALIELVRMYILDS